VDGDHFLILFAIRAVIETNRNPAVVDVGPAPDESMVGDVERETFWRMRGRAGAAMLRQIAHNPAQSDSNAVAIPSVVRNGVIPALLDLAVGRCRAVEGMESTVLLRGSSIRAGKNCRGRTNPPRPSLEEERTPFW
jgi:hypothetical protein